jgi:diguanylate cyclase (GGDEF)-like protein
MPSLPPDDDATASFSLEDLLRQAGKDTRKIVGTLTCLAGHSLGKIYRLDRPSVLVGRVDDAIVRLDDEGISRRHAEITCAEGIYTLRDLGSTNGTILNGTRIAQPEVLHDGDRIRFGGIVVLRFEFQDELEEQVQSMLYDMATRDALTGAYNRRFLQDRLQAEWAWAFRHRRPCACVALDLDHFKQVNDTYGHAAGDYVLKEVVLVVHRTIRKEDLFARVGGEEFVVLARATDRTEAVTLAQRVRVAIEGHAFVFGAAHLRITVSAGVATTLDPGIVTTHHLTARADEYLYQAKVNGRNRVEWDRNSPTSTAPGTPVT